MVLKLRQGQVWQQGDTFIRIVELHRLEVRYKICPDLTTGEGQHHHTSKKEFCRLLKTATLLRPIPPAENSPPPAPLS